MVSAGAIVMVCSLALLYYDIRHFRPHLSLVADIVAKLDPSSDKLSPEFEQILVASMGQGLSCWSANLLYREAHYGAEPPRPSVWKRTYPVWCVLTRLHLSHRERLALVIELTPVGNDQKGLRLASSEIFGKSLSEVNGEEAATLVALSYAPYLRNDPNKLAGLAKRLAKRVRRET